MTLLRALSIEAQVESLVKNNRYEEALSLCDLCPEAVRTGNEKAHACANRACPFSRSKFWLRASQTTYSDLLEALPAVNLLCLFGACVCVLSYRHRLQPAASW